MINQMSEDLKAHMRDNRANQYGNNRVLTVEKLVHFSCGNEAVRNLLSKWGMQHVDGFRTTLLAHIVQQNVVGPANPQGQNGGNPNPNDRRANYFENAYGAEGEARGRGNQRVPQARVINNQENDNDIVVDEMFRVVYEQAQIVEYKKINGQEEAGDVRDTEIEGIDPTFDSFLRGFANYLTMQRIQNNRLSEIMQQNGFDWKKFLENKNALEEFCINLNQLARDGKIDKIIGRDDEILMAAQILGKKKKPNPVFVGKAGVGKTAVAEGLAYKIVHEQDEVPHTLVKAVIYSLNTSQLVSGTSFRGQFEERLNDLISSLKKVAKEEDILPVLFIDELHSIVGTGGAQGTTDMANALKAVLDKGEIRCMGATTTAEWNKHIKNDHALNRRFHLVNLVEPTREETIDILSGAKKYYEEKHGLEYTEESITRCVDLAIKHNHKTALPDKAIDLMDFCGSKYKILCQESVGSSEMEEAASRYYKIPLRQVQDQVEEDEETLMPLSPRVKLKVFGQDSQIDTICEFVEVSKAGMGEPNKPIGSFLLTGPTGVGKTETAKQLAEELGIAFQRIDMSEFMEAHSISKLIGAPPGYVGHTDTPLLSRLISETPHCVLLFDELEKAHPDIYPILLQAMDRGIITDSQGEEINFENVVILMTSNAGAKVMGTMGLSSDEDKGRVDTKKSDAQIKKYFPPEFIGRLDAMVRYNKLNASVMPLIVEKRIKFVNTFEGLMKKGLTLELDQESKDYLAKAGYNVEYGARPLEKLIKKQLVQVVAKELSYGKLRNVRDSKVLVTMKDGEMELNLPKKPKAKK